MCVHGIGLRLCQVELPHLLPHIPRDELDRRLHFRHHALRFRDPLQARLTEMLLLGHATDHIDVLLDISGNELAIATYPSLEVDKVVGVADGADALTDLRSRLRQAVVLLLRSFNRLRGLIETRRGFWRATRAAPSRWDVTALGCSCTRMRVFSACTMAL